MTRDVAASGRRHAQAGSDHPDGHKLPIRLKITSTLAVIGGVCGAGAGAVLTYLGNVISGYPIPPTAGIYAWNAGIMGAIGALFGPPMAWWMLRAVPLWRAVAEPAAAALGASVLSVLFAPAAPAVFLAATPLAAFGAALRLRWEYREREAPAPLLPPHEVRPLSRDP